MADNGVQVQVSSATIESALRRELQPDRLVVTDESFLHEGHAGSNGTGVGTHFRVTISSPLFAGRNRVAQHRMIYAVLQPFFDAGLHALAIESSSG